MTADTVQPGLFDQADPFTQESSPGWRVRVSNRARTLRIQVYPHGGVEIIAPRRTQPAVIQAFVAEHRAWIDQTRRKFERIRPAEAALPDSIHLAALDSAVTVHYNAASRARVKEEGNRLFVTAPALDPANCWPLLQRWLKSRARRQLSAAAWRIAEQIDLQPARVHIRLQRSRWGSCSSTGTVSLNAALLLRTPEELNYVIVHELCHLRHMNHSQRYWRFVAGFVPDYQLHEAALEQAWQTSPQWLTYK